MKATDGATHWLSKHHVVRRVEPVLVGSQIACHIACDVCALPDMLVRLVLLYMCVHPSVCQTGYVCHLI